MTVIAYDGNKLAADKQATSHNYGRTVVKVYEVPGGAVGFTGSSVRSTALLRWFQAGCPMDSYPEPRANEVNEPGGCVLITTDKEIFIYDHVSPYPEQLFDRIYAAGAGRDYALAAMHLGFDAADAVRCASFFDVFCGKGVDVVDPQHELKNMTQ